MSIPVWTTTLPQGCLRADYSEDYLDNVLRSQGDTGQGKTRPKGASLPQPYTRKLYLTDSQRSTFITFIKVTLNQGSLRFQDVHPVDGTLVELRFLPQGDKIYSLTREGQGWSTVVRLQVMP